MEQRIENFSMKDFIDGKTIFFMKKFRIFKIRTINFSELEERKLDLEGEVFDMLFTLTDFLAFKEMFVSYKIAKSTTSAPLQEILSITSLL